MRPKSLLPFFMALFLTLGANPQAMAGPGAAAPANSSAQADTEPDPDRYIVAFTHTARGKAALQAAGARIELDLPLHSAAAAHIPAAALAGLRQNPNIDYIEPDHIRVPLAQTTPWGISAIGAGPATEGGIQPGGSARKICIIDSGFSALHEDLNSINVTGTNDDTGAGDWNVDSCGHGTHVAGTIAAQANDVGVVGAWPGVDLHIVKVFDGSTCRWS